MQRYSRLLQVELLLAVTGLLVLALHVHYVPPSLENLIPATVYRFKLNMGFETVDNDEEFIFTDRLGNKILPTFRPMFPGAGHPGAGYSDSDVPAETFRTNIVQIQRFRPDITPDTCRSKWKGENMDYDMAVQALMDRESPPTQVALTQQVQ